METLSPLVAQCSTGLIFVLDVGGYLKWFACWLRLSRSLRLDHLQCISISILGFRSPWCFINLSTCIWMFADNQLSQHAVGVECLWYGSLTILYTYLQVQGLWLCSIWQINLCGSITKWETSSVRRKRSRHEERWINYKMRDLIG